MHLISQNMNPSMITLRDSKPGDDSTAASQEVREGSDQGSSAPSDTGELQFNQTINSDNDCCDAEQPASSRGNNTNDMALKFEAISCDIQGVRKSQDRLNKDLDVLNIKYRRDNMVIMEALQEHTLRCDALEQQLTNLTEHRREIANLKEKRSKIGEHVDYKARKETELQGAPEACHTSLPNMELQQQQAVPEDTTAWIVLRKVISLLLVVWTAFLVCVPSLSHFAILLKPSGRMFSVLLFAVILYFTWKYWDYLPVLELIEM